MVDMIERFNDDNLAAIEYELSSKEIKIQE